MATISVKFVQAKISLFPRARSEFTQATILVDVSHSFVVLNNQLHCANQVREGKMYQKTRV